MENLKRVGKSKGKRTSGKNYSLGYLQLFVVMVVMAGLIFVALNGIGNKKFGAAKNIKLGLDLAGGVSITYESVKANPTESELDDTIYKLQKRVQNYSTEAIVYQEGSDRINVDIPGVTDANAILKELGKAGALQFKDSNGTIVLDGSDIQTAEAVVYGKDLGNEYLVDLTMTPAGTEKFAKATKENIGKPIYIYYDNELIKSPIVQTEITGGKAQIEGQASFDEAKELASIIRIGALPLELREIRSNIVGAQLGQEAIETSLLAGVVGFILVILFMIIWYRVPGLASSIALIFYITIVSFAILAFNVTLTLPGIAGIILSIGMAVDANVIIFTRIREELGTGKTVRSAMKIGFNKALSAIIDGNVTTLIAAVVLWLRGTGPVKGFAQTLAIGIVVSMFTALTVTKFIMNILYSVGLDKESMYGTTRTKEIIPFIKHRAKFFILSLLIILLGFVALGVNKVSTGSILSYGLDFKGGTSTNVSFHDNITDQLKNDVRAIVSDIIKDPKVEMAEVKNTNSIIIKTRELSLDERTQIEEKLVEVYNIDVDLLTTESISASVSGDMKKDALFAIIMATVAMLLYIWFRFKDIRYASSAVLALIHDVLVVLMVYSVGKIAVGGTFIACMLTIVGYSINATIIIFDRIRENATLMNKNESFEEIVNTSISQSFSRCINTSLTTFFMVFVLLIFGVDSVKEFAIPLMVGIVCGAYSSICITGALIFTLKNNLQKKMNKI